MFSNCKQERDAEGRDVIELGMDLKRAKIMLMAAPAVFVLAGYFFLDIPALVMFFMLAFVLAAIAVIGFPALATIAEGSKVRVTLDSKTGRLLVETASGQAEIRMADLEKAEFGASVSTRTDSNNNVTETTVYRLEFVKRNGERVPATDMYSSSFSFAHREQMVSAINAALLRRMV